MSKPNEVTIDGVAYIRKDITPQPDTEGRIPVLVRTREDGVSFGYLNPDADVQLTSNLANVKLHQARQLWTWGNNGGKDPRFTLAAVANKPAVEGTRVSVADPWRMIQGVCSIRPMAEGVLESLVAFEE